MLYWGGGLDGQGWDLNGRQPGGFPRIDPRTDALLDSWKGRMENAQVTLRMCASEGPGFKRYLKHFMMLSSQACMEFRLPQYHRFNTEKKRKVLTERIVIGGILESYSGSTPGSGIRVSNNAAAEGDYLKYVRRRARRYRLQAHRLGGHFAALILDGAGVELKIPTMVAATASADASTSPAQIKRLLVILGGPHGIRPEAVAAIRQMLEKYTDFPMIGVALPGGILHSYYALANLLIFHDHGLLLPYLQTQVGLPRPPEPETPKLQAASTGAPVIDLEEQETANNGVDSSKAEAPNPSEEVKSGPAAQAAQIAKELEQKLAAQTKAIEQKSASLAAAQAQVLNKAAEQLQPALAPLPPPTEPDRKSVV